jgi:hypothetical protein
MAEKGFTDTIEEKLALITPTLNAIEFGGDQPYLRELQTLLRPHLASLVVLDAGVASQPLAQKRRLLREALTCFHERLSTARPNGRRVCAA